MKLEKYLWKYLVKHGEKKAESDVCHCGSCRYYDFTYDSQLEGKREWVSFMLKNAVGYETPISIVRSPKVTFYRSRMDFVATKGLIGLRKSGGFNNVYDVEHSCIFDPNIGSILAKLRTFKKYPDYDLLTHEGIIRYFVFRKTEHAGKTLWHLSVVLKDIPESFGHEFTTFLKDNDLWKQFNSLCLVYQPSLTDLSTGEITTYLKEGTILQDITTEKKQFSFTYGPQSFFQANVSVFELVLKYMRDLLKETTYSTVYDLYGGVGSIGIALADLGNRLVNVEISEENTAYFNQNLELNHIGNGVVIQSTVDEYLTANSFESDSLVIFDPPRVGVEKKVLEKFLAKEELPKTILYMSCNPSTQAEDLKLLTTKYKISDYKVFDMFPSASHVEAVGKLELIR